MTRSNVKLTPRWDRWRRTRRRAMMRSGMPETAATEFSLFEAMGRQRIARTIGLRAAEEAELGRAPQSDGFDEFFLVVDPRKVTVSGPDADDYIGLDQQAPAQSPAERACENDRDWFATHPGRNFRIRAMIPGELFPDPCGNPIALNGESMGEAIMKIAAFSSELRSGFPVAPPGFAHFVLVQKIAEGARLRSHLLLSNQIQPDKLTKETTELIAVAFGML